MNLLNNKLAVLLLAGALLLLAGCGGERSGYQTAESRTEEDQTAGDRTDVPEAEEVFRLGEFTAGTLAGGTFTAEDVAARDVTVINFWSTTCGPCIDELPDLAAIEIGRAHV